MGNCMRRHESSAVWAGDDWGSTIGSSGHHEENDDGDDDHEMEKSCSRASRDRVKIKMTKREVEELVAAAETSGLSIEQLLATFINQHYRLGGDDDDHHHKHWRPNLQTIPEN